MNKKCGLRMFKNYDQQKLIKAFLPILAVIFLSLLLLAGLFSTSFTKLEVKVITQNYTSSLSMIGKYYQQLRFNTVPIASTLLDDTSVEDYLFGRKPKDEAIIGALTSIENVVTRNSYLNSIYLYNEQYGFISNVKGEEDFSNLYDPSLIDFINTHPKNNTLYQRSVSTESVSSFNDYFFSGGDKEILNLFTICNNCYDNDGKLKYGVIVNLDETKARQLFFSDMEGAYANFYMFEEDGKFLSHPNPEEYGKEIKDFPMFQTINNQTELTGNHIIKDSEGNKFLACWITQNQMKWKLVYLIPMDIILMPIKKFRNKLIITFFIVLFFAIISFILVSKRTEKALSRKARLTSYIKGNIDISSFIAYHPQSLFSVALISITPKNPQHDMDEQFLSNIKPYDYIQNYLKLNNIFEYLLYIDPCTYLILNNKEIPKKSSYLKKLQINIKDDLDVEINSIYVDELITFETLPEITQSLYSTLKTNILEKRNFTIPYEPIISDEQSGVVLFQTNNLEKALIMKDSKIFDAEVFKVINALKAQKDWELFKSLKVYLYYAFESTCTKYLKIKSIAFLEEWKKHITNASTYDELEEALLEIDSLIEQANTDESIRHQAELIQSIKDIVENNLTDINLSSSFIADELKLSIGYVRSQFKSIEGESINDYIGIKRLIIACNLLIETEKSVNTIREEVGFLNYSYFCTYFKKIKGCSPSNYRKQIISQNILKDKQE